jgi:hypothetical protein
MFIIEKLTELTRGPHRVRGEAKQLVYPMHLREGDIHRRLDEVEDKQRNPKDGMHITFLEDEHDIHFDGLEYRFFAGRVPAPKNRLPVFSRPRLHMRGPVTPVYFLSSGLLFTGDLNETRDAVKTWHVPQHVRRDDEVLIPRGTPYAIANPDRRGKPLDFVFSLPERPTGLAEDTYFVDELGNGVPPGFISSEEGQ